ncbi:unnamed protein product [Protopolystoma xenopodis]|uniref:Uncharacterized protein n=1 Tax=Protopolystoma xenopodis TaxID=117903 RepID=A0A448XQK2_9PLAT|nr:unnamed protein product [Protopolystoma xenopodis]
MTLGLASNHWPELETDLRSCLGEIFVRSIPCSQLETSGSPKAGTRDADSDEACIAKLANQLVGVTRLLVLPSTTEARLWQAELFLAAADRAFVQRIVLASSTLVLLPHTR